MQHVAHLREVTYQRYEDFLDGIDEDTAMHMWLPPYDVISSIVRVNSQKRQKAFRRTVEAAQGNLPPETIISSIMNYGAPIPGVADYYLDADYPSHEVFAYNRLGKLSMLNRRFGKRCIEAMQHAYPESVQVGAFENLRARVHRILDTSGEKLAVISTKEAVDRRTHNDRTSLLVSRVTGVARLDHAVMDSGVKRAIETLAEHACSTDRLIGAKALLTDFVREYDDSEAVLPVIQTMYQTQR